MQSRGLEGPPGRIRTTEEEEEEEEEAGFSLRGGRQEKGGRGGMRLTALAMRLALRDAAPALEHGCEAIPTLKCASGCARLRAHVLLTARSFSPPCAA